MGTGVANGNGNGSGNGTKLDREWEREGDGNSKEYLRLQFEQRCLYSWAHLWWVVNLVAWRQWKIE